MRIHKCLLVLLLLNLSVACAQKKTTSHKTEINIVDNTDLIAVRTIKEIGEISILDVHKDEDIIYRFETFKQPKFIYNLANNIPLHTDTYKKGSIFLLSFQAKSEKSSLETGEAKALWMFKQSPSYKHNLTTTLSLSSEWKMYYVPIQATRDIEKRDLGLIIQFGYRPQSFLIKNIKFEVFPAGTQLSDLPKTKITYQGMEANATWRIAANKRIEKIRKGDFTLQFIKNAKPIAHKNIQITLKKHAFPFGAALGAKDVVDNTRAYQKFKESFSLLVFENDLKIKHWQFPEKREITLQALELTKSDDIKVKGHVLIWPGLNYLTQEIKDNKDNPGIVTTLIENHVRSILQKTKGKVSHWDVVNEVYTNKDLQKITGSEKILYDGFRTVKEKQPNSKRFTNEYGIISKGGIDTQKQQWYFDFIKRVDQNTDGLVDGIGIQSHMGSDLTAPKKVLEILNFYGKLNKDISISEFTMDVQEPEIREQYTRDFMIAAFSHPNVSEFLFWGFVDNKRHKVDIYTPDGKVGVMGKAYFDLVHDQWNTNLSIETNEKGTLKGQGFYGTYEYSLMLNNKLITGTFVFEPNAKNTFVITM